VGAVKTAPAKAARSVDGADCAVYRRCVRCRLGRYHQHGSRRHGDERFPASRRQPWRGRAKRFPPPASTAEWP